MRATATLLELLRKGAQLWVEGDELSIQAAKGVLTPALREELSRHKPEIIALLGQRARYASCSFAQQLMWLADQIEPGTPTYNTSKDERLTGRLDPRALERSLDEIVRRHETLRTTFTAVDGSPVQVIAPASATTTLPLIDLSELPQAEREAEARRLAREEARRPFDLERGPLFRAKLLRLGEQEHVLLVTMHHIVSDGWSTGVFRRELKAHYEAFSEGKPSPLAELPIQYADYAIWQREWLRGEVLAEQLDYWKRQLAGVAPLQLPTDRPRPAIQTHRGARQELVLSESLTDALKALGRREGATLFMVLLAAFQVLLSRYAGQDDVAVGTPIAGRNRAETEGLIGFFVNTLVMRTDLSGDPTFKEVLGRVREVCLGAYAHQELPFEKLVEELKPERDLSRTPLFQVFFNMQNVDEAPIELSGLTAERIMQSHDESMFDFTLYIAERPEGLRLRLVYNADLFDQARMAEMLEQLGRLLGQIVDDPQSTIGYYSLVTPRAQTLLPDPETVVSEPRHELVTNTFLSWADHTPQQPAVRQGKRVWDYGELSASARALAHYLLAQGIEPGDVVALHGARSFGLIAGMMAVLLSRGVFLTVDRNLPVERQRLMLREAGAKHVFFIGERQPEDEWVRELPSLVVTSVASETGRVIEPQGIPNPEAISLPVPVPDDPAYIFFTSGTTGTPKGILGCHKGISHFLDWQRETFAVGPRDRCAQLSGLSFDVLLRDVFLPLTSGATLCLPEEKDNDLSADRIMPWLERERISLLHTVPTLVQSWLRGVPAGISLRALRCVFFAGEPLTDALVRRWREAFPEAGTIVNLYGPTETTMAKCYFRTGSPPDISPGIQPVGWPLPQTQALVLSKVGHVCGIGEPGEIVIRTPFRSLGYIGADRENGKRFVRNPWRDEEGDLLYYTGDRGRYRTDGALEYLGRLDHQVKIRGVRVEPGEVEAVLAQHLAVRECVVVAQDDVLLSEAPFGSKRLVAYVVPAQNHTPAASGLRGFLKEKLPAYMVPSSFVVLEELPLTPNGKIDRRALPAPELSRAALGEAYVEPRTPIEKTLSDIWAGILILERVGIHDDFFGLGGHSLLATRVISQVRDVFRVELPLRSLFEEPTVAGLAEKIEEAHRAEHDLPAPPPLVPISRGGQLPLSFAQVRMWLADQIEPGTPTYNTSKAVGLTGRLDPRALERSLDEIVRRHETLRTTFTAVDGSPVQVIAPASATTTLPLIDLSGLPQAEREAEARRLAREEARRPFDLERGPLFRTKLLRLGEQEHVLLLTMHHIVSDGWSTGIIWRELGSLYNTFSSREPTSSPLPELPIQYADYAIWQREWLRGEVLAEQLDYWKRQLAGVAPLQLPTDRPRPAIQTHRGARQELVLSESLTDALKALGRREGATLFMVLLAAFQVLLSRYAGQDDVAVGTPIAGRNRAETEGLIGFFVNTLVMRTDLSGDPTFKEVLGRVREVCLGAYAHQELPFEKLIEELKPERDLSRTPLFQVLLLMLNARDAPIELSGLTAKRIPRAGSQPKFDLTLAVAERPEGLRLRLVYNADLFIATTISRMLGHLQTLLEGIVADPDRQPVSILPLLTEGERHQLLVEWNDTQTEYPEVCIHRLFEAQVERTPDAVAVVFEDERLSYRQLNEKANQTASALAERGIEKGSYVPVLMDRSIEVVISLLSIMKLGAAFVPLDSRWPIERLRWVLDDLNSELILLNKDTSYQAEALGQPSLLVDAPISSTSVPNPNIDIDPSEPIYVIYTSGSTGNPKGAINAHRGITNRLLWMNEFFGRESAAVALQTTHHVYDSAVWQLFWPLINGGSTVIPSPELEMSAGYLATLVEKHGVTITDFVPSVFNEIVPQLASSSEMRRKLGSLRSLVVGGEEITPSTTYSFLDHFPGVRVTNLYGPTEASIGCICHEVRGNENARIPIGKPIANAHALVLDRDMNLVPVGVVGELYISGSCLGLGYLNDEIKTRAAFVENPFDEINHAKLYKTGDLARYLPDGEIEFLGRIDQQVKIRGFRIELGEIESALKDHPAVRQSAVVLREDVPEQKLLAAYVVPEGTAPSHRELRAFVRQMLPGYMVPSAFVLLDELPLTPNGKVDRQALPVPEDLRAQLDTEFVAPRGTLEEKLAEIWGQVLGVERVGAHDNFFELGGHSLLATRVVSRVREIIGVELPLLSLFEEPTVVGLAERIERVRWANRNLQASPTTMMGDRQELEI